ncbi:MAG: MerR family transcriptional regulator [Pyrinomonadaceae bacterium]
MINLNRAAVPIPEKLFFKIGEVCDITGVQAHVLRYWESEFPMLAPQKNRAGQRTYRKRDVEMALRIKELLYDDQYTIAGAIKRLAAELRGASKLKMVTPDMTPAPQPAVSSAPSSSQLAASTQPTPASPVAPPPADASASFAAAPQLSAPDAAATLSHSISDSGGQGTALRHISEQLHELLMLLDSNKESGSKLPER